MVCPVCVATAVVANAPTIAAAMSGAAAVTLAFKKRGVVCVRDQLSGKQDDVVHQTASQTAQLRKVRGVAAGSVEKPAWQARHGGGGAGTTPRSSGAAAPRRAAATVLPGSVDTPFSPSLHGGVVPGFWNDDA
mmetsp:Transcript_35895/g.106085  ORF Transcript_35895/g.106085 Transcript_35895/m.106085 type:complete len:133 (-) Transcript_35895:365-763(-)